MTHPIIPIGSLSAEFRRGFRQLLDQEDLDWVQQCSAGDLDKGLLAFRDAVISMGLERYGHELREVNDRLVEHGVLCPVCSERMTENRTENHGWETSVGMLDLRRSYLECREDKVRFFPLDAQMKLPAIGRATPKWANALSQLAVELPYEPGARLLKALTQRDISAKTIDAQAQRDGSTLHSIELEEAKRLWPYDEKGYPRFVDPAVIRAVVEGAVFHAPPTGSVLVLQGDGAMINLAADEEIKKERQKETEKARKQRRLKGGQAASEESDSVEEQEGSPFRESIQLLIYTEPVRGRQRKRAA